MKRPKKKFDKAREARRRARRSGIEAASTRVIADKRDKPPKHKRDALRDLENL